MKSRHHGLCWQNPLLVLTITVLLSNFGFLGCEGGSVGVPVDGDQDTTELEVDWADPIDGDFSVDDSDTDGDLNPFDKETPTINVPGRLNFGSVIINTIHVKDLVIANDGGRALEVSDISLSDATSPEFTLLNTPTEPFFIENGAPFTLQVQYQPVDEGADEGTLIIYSRDPIWPVVRVLLTSDYKGNVSFAAEPETLDFGLRKVGTERACLDVLIRNKKTGEDDNKLLWLTGIHLENEPDSYFKLDSNIPDEILIPPDSSYVFEVCFDPAREGVFENWITIPCNDPLLEDSIGYVHLLAEAGLPHLEIEPAITNNEINFGPTRTHSTATKDFKIRNVGRWPLAVSSMYLEGTSSPYFSITDESGAVIDAGSWSEQVIEEAEDFSFSINYSPEQHRADVGMLAIVSDSGGLDATYTRVSLAGIGTELSPVISPDSLDFGDVTVNTSSNPLRVVLFNGANQNLTITSVSYTSGVTGYTATPAAGGELLGQTINAGDSMEIDVVFQPTFDGIHRTTLSIGFDLAEYEPVAVDLLGRGVSAYMTVDVPEMPDFVDTLVFGPVPLTQNLSRRVRLFSSGSADLEISEIALRSGSSTAFSVSHAPLAPMQTGDYMEVLVTYAPEAPAGPDQGTLDIRTNVPNFETYSIALTGEGVDVRAVIIPADNPQDFGEQGVGIAASRSYQIQRQGYGDLVIHDVDIAPESRAVNGFARLFNTPNPLPFTIPNGDSAVFEFSVTFTPVSEGNHAARLIVDTNDYVMPRQVIALKGNGQSSDAVPRVLPESPFFIGSAYPNTTLTAGFQVYNDGTQGDLFLMGAILRMNVDGAYSVVLPDTEFPRPHPIPPGGTESYNFALTFSPPEAGLFNVEVVVLSAAGSQSHETVVDVSGEGLACPDGCWNNDDNPTDCEYCDCWISNNGVEICDNLDNDCDGILDNPDASTLTDNCVAPPHARAYCNSGSCDYICDVDFHLCDGACVYDYVVDHCGLSCDACDAPLFSDGWCRDLGQGPKCGYDCYTGYEELDGQCLEVGETECCGVACEDCYETITPPENAYPACIDDACGYQCNVGFHNCAGACVSDFDVLNCGQSCVACVVPDNATANCNGRDCGFTCNDGYHREGDVCVANGNQLCCGPDCEICTEAPQNGYPVCTGITCDFACLVGYHRCGDECMSDTSIEACGVACDVCPAPTNGVPVCANRICDFICNEGYHREGNSCLIDDDPNCCGPTCEHCVAPEHAIAVCLNDSCDFYCLTGYHREGMMCVVDDNPNCCGDDCEICTAAPENGIPACIDGSCSFTCISGFHACSDFCAPDNDPNFCGAACEDCQTIDNAVPTCSGGECGIQCVSGYHLVGEACVNNSDPTCCGGDCTDCTAIFPQHSNAYCLEGGYCSYTCNQGFHKCDGVCVSNYDTESCGHSCDPCPEVENAQQLCVAGHCTTVCYPGFHDVDGECVANDSNDCCGVDCERCGSGPSHGDSICIDGQCTFTCDEGYHLCGASCVRSDNVNHCGSSCTPCPIPENGIPTCVAGQCGIECKNNYHLDGGICVPD